MRLSFAHGYDAVGAKHLVAESDVTAITLFKYPPGNEALRFDEDPEFRPRCAAMAHYALDANNLAIGTEYPELAPRRTFDLLERRWNGTGGN